MSMYVRLRQQNAQLILLKLPVRVPPTLISIPERNGRVVLESSPYPPYGVDPDFQVFLYLYVRQPIPAYAIPVRFFNYFSNKPVRVNFRPHSQRRSPRHGVLACSSMVTILKCCAYTRMYLYLYLD